MVEHESKTSKNSGPKEIVFSKSLLPVVRAGGQNALILMLAVCFLAILTLWHDTKINLVLAYSGSVLFGLIFPFVIIRRYVSLVSRIEVTGTEIHLLCSLRTLVIPFEGIEYIKFRERSKEMVIMKIKEKKRSYSRRFFLPFFLVKSDYISNAIPKLRQMFADRNIVLKE